MTLIPFLPQTSPSPPSPAFPARRRPAENRKRA